MKTRSKYGNRICTVQGVKFHSQKEALRWLVLKDMVAHGDIMDLQRQVTFPLRVNGSLVCKLVIDFTYSERDDFSRLVAEDAKGYQTAESKLKMKLAAALHPEVNWRLS